jgi:diguanylate cyclase (GGDEF)-like protein
MQNILANVLVIAGAGVLIVALFYVSRLVGQLPSGLVRRRWHILSGLIGFFFLGYIGYTVVFWNRHTAWLDLLVPTVFFFGAGFVWLTVTLALRTAIDIRRVAVLEQENITDPLLGIYNRRYLDRRLQEEFTRARRYSLPLSLLLLDVDHFKRVNDTYGHQVGDLVLNYLGKLLLSVIRATDIIARYGGEEILILTPNTTLSAAAMLAERMRQHVETHELVLTSEPDKRQAIRITISIGVTELGRDVANTAELVHNADAALYRAKEEGRNRVVLGA